MVVPCRWIRETRIPSKNVARLVYLHFSTAVVDLMSWDSRDDEIVGRPRDTAPCLLLLPAIYAVLIARNDVVLDIYRSTGVRVYVDPVKRDAVGPRRHDHVIGKVNVD